MRKENGHSGAVGESAVVLAVTGRFPFDINKDHVTARIRLKVVVARTVRGRVCRGEGVAQASQVSEWDRFQECNAPVNMRGEGGGAGPWVGS